MSLIVRQAVSQDIPGLTELMYTYIVDFYQRPKPAAEKIDQLIDMLLTHDQGIQFVAEKDEELVGFATLYFSYSTTKADKITVMNDLFVVENERGNGVAQELFQACHHYSNENDFAHMAWVTVKDNYRAQRFYEKMGGTTGDWINYSI
ncbi:GNAT family N-acetyltransferase [Gracilibacillus ureilyticus]|nr:GNAT family N-acetyltransferase [Gracilibacillus ureilyticus]